MRYCQYCGLENTSWHPDYCCEQCRHDAKNQDNEEYWTDVLYGVDEYMED